MSDTINFEIWGIQTLRPDPARTKVSSDEPKSVGKEDKRFIKAPLPYDWITRAAKLGGKSLHAAMAIRYMSGLTSSNTVKLTHRTMIGFGINVKASYTVIRRLEEGNLITVERRKGRSPIVTIV